MSDYDEITEVLARGWIACDPNRGGTDPDEPISRMETDGSHKEPVAYESELTGKPTWHWFVPRANALLDWLDQNGLEIRPKE